MVSVHLEGTEGALGPGLPWPRTLESLPWVGRPQVPSLHSHYCQRLPLGAGEAPDSAARCRAGLCSSSLLHSPVRACLWCHPTSSPPPTRRWQCPTHGLTELTSFTGTSSCLTPSVTQKHDTSRSLKLTQFPWVLRTDSHCGLTGTVEHGRQAGYMLLQDT